MASHMVERWHPVLNLVERPATTFDISWAGGEQRLIAAVRYATEASVRGQAAGAIITFENVLAFQVFDENMEVSGVVEDAAAALNVEYPYGGRWPYLEVHSSDWVTRLVAQDCVWSAAEIRHLVITARNMHLHVAFGAALPPAYNSID